jgi:glyoxylase-like metal-dependent hydrolase (beta-lactamase superfamily II)
MRPGGVMKDMDLENAGHVLTDLAKGRGIHLFEAPTPVPGLRVNIYFVERPVPTLIDAPMKDALSLAELSEQLQPLGYSLNDIEVIIVTHPHIDHFGSAADIAEMSGAEVWATEDTARWLENYDSECLEEEQFQKTFLDNAGVPADIVADVGRYFQFLKKFACPVRVSRRLYVGEVVELGSGRFRPEHVPGHTPWCVMMVDEGEKMAFTGDFLLKDISSNPLVQRPWKLPAGYRSIEAYTSSLRHAAGMGLRLALPGHGEVMRDPPERISALLGFMAARTKQVMDVLGTRSDITIYEIVKEIFPELPRDEIFLAVSEVFAHLDLLEGKGIVLRTCESIPSRYILCR